MPFHFYYYFFKSFLDRQSFLGFKPASTSVCSWGRPWTLVSLFPSSRHEPPWPVGFVFNFLFEDGRSHYVAHSVPCLLHSSDLPVSASPGRGFPCRRFWGSNSAPSICMAGPLALTQSWVSDQLIRGMLSVNTENIIVYVTENFHEFSVPHFFFFLFFLKIYIYIFFT